LEIWHEAQRLEGKNSDGVVALCHWIIPRDRAAFLVAPLGMAVDMFDFLAAKTEGGDILPVIALRVATYSGSFKTSRAINALAALLLVSVVLGLLVFEFAQAGVATYLEEQLAGARQAVHGGQNSSAQLTRMYALKSEPGFLAIWDELSRTLPNDTFLSEIRMSAGRLTISGYSSQAAHLVRTIDQSPIFSDATLVAAITPDANERIASVFPSSYATASLCTHPHPFGSLAHDCIA
jgi:general secretion pathway protein L